MPDLNLGHSLDDLVMIDNPFPRPNKCASCRLRRLESPVSVEDENKRDAWLTHPTSVELVFTRTGELWQIILREKGWKYGAVPSPEFVVE